MTPRSTNEVAAASRSALLVEARRRFAADGFEGARTEDLVAAVGLTRGALYHHFGSKAGLFREVVEETEAELVRRVAEAATGGGSLVGQLRRGLHTYLDLCLEADLARVIFIDGPAVLGWDAWLEIDERHALGMIVATVEGVMGAGLVPPQPADPLAQVVLGALTRAGVYVARSEDPARARAEMGAVLDRVLDGLEGR